MLDDSGQERWEGYVRQLREVISAGRRGDAVELFMTLVGMPREAVTQLRNAPMWPLFEGVAPSLVYDAAVLGDKCAVPTERAAAMSTPTLVMGGGASPAWRREAAHTAANAIPNAQYRTLEGQTHEVNPEV